MRGEGRQGGREGGRERGREGERKLREEGRRAWLVYMVLYGTDV